MVHPITGRKSTFIIYFTAWGIVFITHAVLIFSIKNHLFNLVLLDSLIHNGLFMFLGLGIWYPVRFLNTIRSQRFSLVINHLAVAVVSLLAWFFLSKFFLSTLISDKESYLMFLDESKYYRIIGGIFYYLIILLIYYLITYYSDLEEKSKKESELKALIRDSELTLLRSQLNPHFLFNSLNSISSLTITDPEAAREMVVKLSEFLRYAIDKNQRDMAYIEDELRNIELYLDIEKVRFDEKLIFEEIIDEQCRKILIPNMILQPLVENAIKHGVYESSEKIKIRLECNIKNNFCTIAITNNFDPEIPSRKGKGVGLKNVRKRLMLNYNRDNLLYINKVGNQFIAQISIPIESIKG